MPVYHHVIDTSQFLDWYVQGTSRIAPDRSCLLDSKTCNKVLDTVILQAPFCEVCSSWKSDSHLLYLCKFQRISIRVSRKDRWSPRFAERVADSSFVKYFFQLQDISDCYTGMTITPAMLWASCQWIRIWQLHQVDHLRTNPEPSTSVRKLVIWPSRIHLKTKEVLVECHRPFKIFT